MQFVQLEPVIDPTRYLAELESLAKALPPGARKFATDPGHYDFSGVRCVKDLSLGAWSVSDGGALVSVARFEPNRWKHDAGLIVTYERVRSVEFRLSDELHVGETRLGSVVLDEVLPRGGGVSHEIAFHGGVILVTCADLTAEWVKSGQLLKIGWFLEPLAYKQGRRSDGAWPNWPHWRCLQSSDRRISPETHRSGARSKAMTTETAHSKYQHLYVVLRIDDLGPRALTEDCLSAVSAFVVSADASDEAGRLNGLRPGGHSRYVVLTTRLKGQTQSDG